MTTTVETTAAEKRGPGRPRMNFESSQGILILEHLRAGYGRKVACLKAGVGYNRFLRQLRTDREYAECVGMAEAIRTESCEYLLYRLVIDPCDTPLKFRALLAYLGRQDRVVAARRTRREKARRESATKTRR